MAPGIAHGLLHLHMLFFVCILFIVSQYYLWTIYFFTWAASE